jgi:hypothetical protein
VQALADGDVVRLAFRSPDAIGARTENHGRAMSRLRYGAPVCDKADFIDAGIPFHAELQVRPQLMHDDRAVRGTIDLTGQITMRDLPLRVS